jgi:hypothetical protein
MILTESKFVVEKKYQYTWLSVKGVSSDSEGKSSSISASKIFSKCQLHDREQQKNITLTKSKGLYHGK